MIQRSTKVPVMEAVEAVSQRYAAHGIDINPHRDRIVFECEVVSKKCDRFGSVIELGGGYTPLPLVLSYMFDSVVVIDDFNDWPIDSWVEITQLLAQESGIDYINADFNAGALNDLQVKPPDAVLSFNCFEHLHRSPKRILQKFSFEGKQVGFFIAMPNSQNLLKRVKAVLGINSWSNFDEWWESELFRGHVREPSVRDMREIAKRMNGSDITIYGRNFIGLHHHNMSVRIFSSIGAKLLNLRPSLCSDLYVFWKS